MREQNNVLRVERALPRESAQALVEFVKLNPRWQGAHWADCLDELDNTDAHCGDVDDTWERLHVRVPAEGSRLIRLVALTLCYAHGGWPPDDVVEAGVLTVLNQGALDSLKAFTGALRKHGLLPKGGDTE